MQAFEFQANVTDGMIVLPDEYKSLVKKSVKVIILQSEIPDKTEDSEKDKKLKALLDSVGKHQIELPSNYRFDREEANERG